MKGAPARVLRCALFLLLTHPATALGVEESLVVAKAAEHEVVLTGFTRARTVLNLATETAGKVEQAFADMGEPIPQDGQVVCLEKIFINLDIERNQAERARIAAEIRYFEKQVRRYRELVKQNSSAQAQLDEFERNLATFGQQLQALKVQQRTLAERRKRHCVTAPPGWLVIERYVEPGQWINAGDVVAKLGDFSKLLIPFALSTPEYRVLVANAERLEIRLPDLDIRVAARIERVSPAFDEQSRKIKLELQIAEGLEQHRGGLRAELSLKVAHKSGAVLIPEEALEQRFEQFWLQRESGEEVKVVYLGRAEGNNPLVQVASPEVRPGDMFKLRN
jgi:RND family efflux transporter MFP subunit